MRPSPPLNGVIRTDLGFGIMSVPLMAYRHSVYISIVPQGD